VGAVVEVMMPRADWVTTSGTTNAHPPPALKATPMAAFMNRPRPVAVRIAAWVWRRVMSK
jgi:hypothetical protein